ncbi:MULTISPECIES: hypothetical protein [unclassified Rhizobium]|uniref:hypothetical protein n=1 Tax=unclassified Rhizobium TaxID=2613769 RepID=UPI00254ED9DD|nr:hypothetical protein [Rhizobium sp. CNPSo 4062]MDK4702520.1 hypothetical protein [Rhizobium sp. CNPSo 4062]
MNKTRTYIQWITATNAFTNADVALRALVRRMFPWLQSDNSRYRPVTSFRICRGIPTLADVADRVAMGAQRFAFDGSK